MGLPLVACPEAPSWPDRYISISELRCTSDPEPLRPLRSASSFACVPAFRAPGRGAPSPRGALRLSRRRVRALFAVRVSPRGGVVAPARLAPSPRVARFFRASAPLRASAAARLCPPCALLRAARFLFPAAPPCLRRVLSPPRAAFLLPFPPARARAGCPLPPSSPVPSSPCCSSVPLPFPFLLFSFLLSLPPLLPLSPSLSSLPPPLLPPPPFSFYVPFHGPATSCLSRSAIMAGSLYLYF